MQFLFLFYSKTIHRMSLHCAIKTKKELGEKNCFLIVKTLINIQKDFSHKVIFVLCLTFKTRIISRNNVSSRLFFLVVFFEVI